MDQKLMFFDEPTAGLDYSSRENIKNIINNIADEGKTMVCFES